MRLTHCIHQFFDQYLTRIKGVSSNTIKAYRDTFKLFIAFAAQYHSVKIDSLKIDHLSSELVLAFLNHLEQHRSNIANTRNQRLGAIKSFAKMLRFMHPDKNKLADTILNIPQKRIQKRLIGFLYPQEIMDVFEAVDLRQAQGFRDYTLLHLLYDSGVRASEAASLNIDYFDYENKTLAVLGKGNRYRQVDLNQKTANLIKMYIKKYRRSPTPLYRQRLFINQRGKEITRHGIYRICKKYLSMALSEKRLIRINPVHSFRHSCAVRMLLSGCAVSEIRNHLGHEDLESTMVYLHLDLARKQQIQKQLITYTQSMIKYDPKLDELTDWKNKEDILTWLDSL